MKDQRSAGVSRAGAGRKLWNSPLLGGPAADLRHDATDIP